MTQKGKNTNEPQRGEAIRSVITHPLFSDDMPGRVEHSAGGVSQVGHPPPSRGQHGHVAAQVTEYCEHFAKFRRQLYPLSPCPGWRRATRTRGRPG